MVDFSQLTGKTLDSIEVNSDRDRIDFLTTDGELFVMYHDQDCCEHVSIDDIVGDLADLVGTPLLLAEEASNSDDPSPAGREDDGGTHTWTYYRLATLKGSVEIKWYGSSNGYYSESVTFDSMAA